MTKSPTLAEKINSTDKLLRLGRASAAIAARDIDHLPVADRRLALRGAAAGLWRGGVARFDYEHVKLTLPEPQRSYEAFARTWANRNLTAVFNGGKTRMGEFGVIRTGLADFIDPATSKLLAKQLQKVNEGRYIDQQLMREVQSLLTTNKLPGAQFGPIIGKYLSMGQYQDGVRIKSGNQKGVFDFLIAQLPPDKRDLVRIFRNTQGGIVDTIGGALSDVGGAVKDAAVAAAKGISWLASKLACNEWIQKAGAAALSSVGVPPQVTQKGSELNCAAWNAANDSLNGNKKPPSAQHAPQALRENGINPDVALTVAHPIGGGGGLGLLLLVGGGVLVLILVARRGKKTAAPAATGVGGFAAKPGHREPASRGAGAKLPSEIKRAMRARGLDPDSPTDYDNFVKEVLGPSDYRQYKKSGAIAQIYGRAG